MLKKVKNFFSVVIYDIWRLSLIRKNVRIGKRCRIEPGVIFDTQCGGSIDIGDDCWFFSGARLNTFGGFIKIGNRSTLNPYCVAYGHGGLVIGNDVSIAAHTVIVPSNHNFEKSNDLINRQGETSLGIRIEDNCWLGCGVRVLDGVTISSGAVVGAGAVVTKSLPPYSVNVGVPAKTIRVYRESI